MARRADLYSDFHSRGLRDAPAPTPAARARNGAYRGDLPVRHLPAGVTGGDLVRAKGVRLSPGQIWLRGDQRVRVTKATKESVWFLELSHGGALRRLARWMFLRYAIPEQALGADDGRDE